MPGSQFITRCDAPDTCRSYGPGHQTHTVQATLAGADPGGWSGAEVLEVHGNGVVITVDGRRRIDAWHHRPLDGSLRPGATVRWHRARGLMEVEAQWLSVACSDPEDDEG